MTYDELRPGDLILDGSSSTRTWLILDITFIDTKEWGNMAVTALFQDHETGHCVTLKERWEGDHRCDLPVVRHGEIHSRGVGSYAINHSPTFTPS